MYRILIYCWLLLAAVTAKETEDWTPCIEQTVHAKAGGYTNMTIQGASHCSTAVFQLDDGSTIAKNISSIPCPKQEGISSVAVRKYRITIGLPQYTPVGRMNLTLICIEGSACRSVYIDPVDPVNRAPLDALTISRECISQNQSLSRPLYDSHNRSTSSEEPGARITSGTSKANTLPESLTNPSFSSSGIVSPYTAISLSLISGHRPTIDTSGFGVAAPSTSTPAAGIGTVTVTSSLYSGSIPNAPLSGPVSVTTSSNAASTAQTGHGAQSTPVSGESGLQSTFGPGTNSVMTPSQTFGSSLTMNSQVSASPMTGTVSARALTQQLPGTNSTTKCTCQGS